MKTNLTKNVEAFLKDEYALKDVKIEIKIKEATGSDTDLRRLRHDSTNKIDFDLID
jgi:hypothetical protein